MFDLNGKYVIFRPEIGKGSYSKVYKAKDKNHKSVAIKRINIEKINNKFFNQSIPLKRDDSFFSEKDVIAIYFIK